MMERWHFGSADRHMRDLEKPINTNKIGYWHHLTFYRESEKKDGVVVRHVRWHLAKALARNV